jgi:hypothetical protein
MSGYWVIDSWNQRVWYVMEMYIVWVVLITALMTFCLWFTYRVGYVHGYKTGANRVLNQWKQTLIDMEDEING